MINKLKPIFILSVAVIVSYILWLLGQVQPDPAVASLQLFLESAVCEWCWPKTRAISAPPLGLPLAEARHEDGLRRGERLGHVLLRRIGSGGTGQQSGPQGEVRPRTS